MNKYLIRKRHLNHTFRKARQIERYDNPKTRIIKKLANDIKYTIFTISGIPFQEDENKRGSK